MEKKSYVSPAIRTVMLETRTMLLEGSYKATISEDPAYEPACSKGYSLFESKEDGKFWTDEE